MHHFSHEAHRALFAMENMEIMDYMANGTEMEQNIVLPATVQAINLTYLGNTTSLIQDHKEIDSHFCGTMSHVIHNSHVFHHK